MCINIGLRKKKISYIRNILHIIRKLRILIYIYVYISYTYTHTHIYKHRKLINNSEPLTSIATLGDKGIKHQKQSLNSTENADQLVERRISGGC